MRSLFFVSDGVMKIVQSSNRQIVQSSKAAVEREESQTSLNSSECEQARGKASNRPIVKFYTRLFSGKTTLGVKLFASSKSISA